ncbi:MAG TPA: hypothetical protein ENH94_06330 [Phycisphaerales bacterium]|nr:hypothetical protein [Phycisphaerales bacterium]
MNKLSTTISRNDAGVIIDKLGGLGMQVKSSGTGKWQAQCPSHEDNHASLSITKNGSKILLYCHAGCSYEQITSALGFPDTRDQFPYRDRHGKKLYTVTRTADKQFPVSQPDGTTNIQGVERVIYGLPEICAAQNGQYLFGVEGEKDKDALAALGLIAFCSPFGAGKWKPEYAKDFKGRRVVLLGDNDEQGDKHVADMRASLLGIAKEVRIPRLDGLAKSGDVTDWLQSGHTVKELLELVDRTKPECNIVLPPALTTEDEPESWLEVVTLSEVEPEDVEWLCPEVIPLGMITSMVSLEGVGKTHVSCDVIARATAGIPWPNTPDIRNPRGDVILYNREEHLAKTIVPRLAAMGADLSRIHLVQTVKSTDAEDSMFELEYNMPELDLLMGRFPKTKLVCFDPITQYVAGNENSNHDIQRALDKLNAFAERYNVAVLILSHFNKKEDARYINRTIGSRAWSAGPRMIWGLEFDPNSEENDVYMSNIKCSIGVKPKGFRFHISGPTGQGKVYWDISRNTRVMGESAEKATKMEECCRWLKEKLIDDAKVPATEIFEDGDDMEFNPIMLKRAKKELDVISIKEGFGKDGVSYWQNPIIQTVSEREI